MWQDTGAWRAQRLFATCKQAGHANIVTRTHTELDLAEQALVCNFFVVEQLVQLCQAAGKVGGIPANKTDQN